VSLTLLDSYMPQTFCVLAEVVGSNNPTTRSISYYEESTALN
jgi:hypothetical protein